MNAGDVLHVTVQNALPAGRNTSIVVPGQRMPTNVGGALLPPVYDGNTPPRVMSFTAESPNGGSAEYYFNAVKAGTYLYESGTEPTVQVGMGLYGAVIVRPANPLQAYPPSATNPNTAFGSEAVLLFSEIDPFLHFAVNDNTYGTTAYPTQIHLDAKYFLINGVPYSTARPPIAIGGAGTTTLLRFLNAGSRIYDPTLIGTAMTLIAEDGNLLPYPETLATLLLPPGKTHDVLVTPSVNGRLPLFDRRLGTVNNVNRPGGAIAALVPAGSDVTGPVVSGLAASPNPTFGASPVLLSATATDIVVDAGSVVMAAEWYTDNTTPAGAGPLDDRDVREPDRRPVGVHRQLLPPGRQQRCLRARPGLLRELGRGGQRGREREYPRTQVGLHRGGELQRGEYPDRRGEDQRGAGNGYADGHRGPLADDVCRRERQLLVQVRRGSPAGDGDGHGFRGRLGHGAGAVPVG